MKVDYHSSAEKFLVKQGRKVAARIITAINKLPAGDVKKLEGYKDRYRLRVGGYRVIFYTCFVFDEETMKRIRYVKVWNIDNRGDIY